mgnify:CR=1 FL=1
MTDAHQRDLDELGRVEAVVTRVVRARVRDAAEVEDLVQEALTRFLVERERTDLRNPEHYAATIALNLVRGRWRRLAREGEVLPLLVDLREPSEPDDLAVDGEVSAALSDALAELDDERRRLLVEHEVAGRSTRELAQASTPAAVAASLARTRARLRVDVVVRYRRAHLPTVACRPVLESLSANDERRKERLGADGHLETCETCAELAAVIARRGTAWLGAAPIATLLRRRSFQAGAATAAAAVAAVAILASIGGDRADEPTEQSATPAAVVEAPIVTEPANPTIAPPEPDEPPPTTPAPPTSVVPPPPSEPSPLPPATEPPTEEPPPAERTAPVVELPVDIGPIGDSLVLDHPVIDPLEPVVCPILELPQPITNCRTDSPSDLPLLRDARDRRD